MFFINFHSYLISQLFQKDGKNKISTANNSSLPRSIPKDKLNLEKSGKSWKLPLGPITSPKPGPTLEIAVAAPDIEEIKSKSYYISGGTFLFNEFTDKIRTLNFVYRATIKIKNKLKNFYYSKFVKKEVDFQNNNLKYYYSDKFFDNSDYKKIWKDNFKKSILEINDIIKPNQRVIIITPLTNYLLPPMADYSEQQSNKKEKILSDFYEKILNKEKLNLFELNKLEEGAHKSYLLAYYCWCY